MTWHVTMNKGDIIVNMTASCTLSLHQNHNILLIVRNSQLSAYHIL